MTTFHLASEYNLNNGVVDDMNQLVQQHLAGQLLGGQGYWHRTLAQVHLAHAMFGLAAPQADYGSVWFDDVSQVRVHGGQTPWPQYLANVAASVPYHQALFAQHRPDVVVVAGAHPFNAFCQVILPALGRHAPRVVVHMRNPSGRATKGNPLPLYGQYRQTWQGALQLPSPGVPTSIVVVKQPHDASWQAAVVPVGVPPALPARRPAATALRSGYDAFFDAVAAGLAKKTAAVQLSHQDGRSYAKINSAAQVADGLGIVLAGPRGAPKTTYLQFEATSAHGGRPNSRTWLQAERTFGNTWTESCENGKCLTWRLRLEVGAPMAADRLVLDGQAAAVVAAILAVVDTTPTP